MSDPDLGWLTLHAQQISQSLASLSAELAEVTRELGRTRTEMAESSKRASRHQRGLLIWTIVLSAATIAYAVAAFLPVFWTPKSASTGATAWVLWVRTQLPGAQPTTTSVLTAMKTFEDCKKAEHEEMARVRSEFPSAKVSVRGETVQVWRAENLATTLITHDYYCLPDTVDPRAPKATGR